VVWSGNIIKEFRNGVTEGGLAPEATLSYDGQFLLSGKLALASVLKHSL
jgi:hypothetical protein